MWREILENQILVCSIICWATAQVLKTIIDCILNKGFHADRLLGSGGMPSSHSSTVCSLATAAGVKYGLGSFEFAVSFILAVIVMHDAMGVRRETGIQAKLLNRLIFEGPLKFNSEILQKKLKEYVGHTPLQVLFGAILGVSLTFILLFYLYD